MDDIESQDSETGEGAETQDSEAAAGETSAPEKNEVRDEPQLLARAKKAESKVKELAGVLENPEALKQRLAQLERTEKSTKETGADVFEQLSAIRNLADDEIEDLRSEADGLGVDPIRFIKSKAGAARLEQFRKEKQVAATTPPPQSKKVEKAQEKEAKKFPSYREWQATKTGGNE